MSTAAQLAALKRAWASSALRVEALAGEASDAQWRRRSPGGGWSAAECVAHLNAVLAAARPLAEAALDAAAGMPPMLRPRWRRDPLGWLISVMVGPLGQSGRLRFGRLATTPAFAPQPPLERDAVMAAFRAHQAAFGALLDDCAGLPIDRVLVASPFDPRMRYNLFSLLHILAAHQRRHALQAERARG